MKNPTSKLVLWALVIASVVAFALLYFASSINILARVVAALAILIVDGIIIQRVLELKGGYGFYIYGGTKGLKFMDRLSKRNKTFWDVMAMWGLTLGFGILTYPLMKGKIDKRVYILGIISIILIMLFVLPELGSGLQFVNLPQVKSALASANSAPQTSGPGILTYLLYAITIFAGFSGFLLLSLFIGAETILWGIVQYAFAPSQAAATSITSQAGVAPLLPGIDVPFIASIISIAVLLVIHEFSHGVLARKAKVKLESTGLLVFGFIPIGGYVEPDENAVAKLDRIKQTKIFSAGVSANFIATIIFFLLVLAFTIYINPYAYHYKVVVAGTQPNYPANGILKPGMQILQWNNISLSNITSSSSATTLLNAARATDKPNGTVHITTNVSSYTFKAVADPTNASVGLIGVSFVYSPLINTPYAKIVYFLFSVFALSMLLNFFVGVLNLAPIPGFDGWRIYGANVKNQKITNFLGALVIILLIVNILPWFFYL